MALQTMAWAVWSCGAGRGSAAAVEEAALVEVIHEDLDEAVPLADASNEILEELEGRAHADALRRDVVLRARR